MTGLLIAVKHLILTLSIHYRVANYVKNKVRSFLDLRNEFMTDNGGLEYV